MQRLRSDLADRETKVDRLRSKALDWKQKCISAVRDRHVIRTHLAQLSIGTLHLPSGVPSDTSATTPTSKRSRSTESHFPIKRPRAAKMTRSGTEAVDTPSVKSSSGSPRSTGPVLSATLSGFTGASPVSARSSRSARSDESKVTSGSARIPSTQGVASETRSAFQAGNERDQKLPARDPPLSDTEPFQSNKEDTLAALSGSRSSLRRCGSSGNAPPSSGSTPVPSIVDYPSDKPGSSPSSSGSAPPSKRPVSKMDLVGEASSEYDGSFSITSDAREDENSLLPPAEYDRLDRPGYPAINQFPNTAIRYPGPTSTYNRVRLVVSA